MTQIGIDRHCVCPVPFKYLSRIIFRSTTHVTPFRIEYQRHTEVLDIGDGFFQFPFRRDRSIVSNLGFIAAGKI